MQETGRLSYYHLSSECHTKTWLRINWKKYSALKCIHTTTFSDFAMLHPLTTMHLSLLGFYTTEHKVVCIKELDKCVTCLLKSFHKYIFSPSKTSFHYSCKYFGVYFYQLSISKELPFFCKLAPSSVW